MEDALETAEDDHFLGDQRSERGPEEAAPGEEAGGEGSVTKSEECFFDDFVDVEDDMAAELGFIISSSSGLEMEPIANATSTTSTAMRGREGGGDDELEALRLLEYEQHI